MADRPDAHLSERAARPRAAADGRVSADAAAAGGQPRRCRSRRSTARSPATGCCSSRCRRPTRDDPEPDDLQARRHDRRHPADGQGPDGGIHIIVEGLARARADAGHARPATSLRATVAPLPEHVERTLEVDAYVRRLQELIERALSLASGLSQELRGAGRRHRRPAAPRLPARQPARHEGRREAAAPRERQPARRSWRRSPRRSTARSRCSS